MTIPAEPPAANIRHRVDVVLSVLLAIGLVGVVAFSAMGLSLGIGMSGDGCGGSGCVSSDAAFAAWVISIALLVIALVVGIGGLIGAATKRRVLSWWPLAGYAIVVAAWVTTIAILD